MARIILILLIFAVVNKQTINSLSIFGIDYNDVMYVYGYINTLYEKGIEYVNKDEIEENSIQNQLKQIMNEMRDMSKQLTNFVNHQDEKMDRVMKKLLNNIEVMIDLQPVRTEFIDCISGIDYWFQKAIEYEINEGYSEKALKNFIKSVLWTENNIDHLLFRMYRLIFPGMVDNLRKSFGSLALQNTEVSYINFELIN